MEEETQETQEETTDELEGLDADSLESQEEEAVIEIDGEPVKLSDVEKIYKDYSNDNNWQATNTQKAQEIAAERQRLDEEKASFEQLRRDTELLLQRSQYQSPQQQEQQDDPYFGLSQEDFEDLTPFEKTILKKQHDQEKNWQTFQTENEKKEFYNQTQAEHSRLKSLYPDYDAKLIERSIFERSDNLLPQLEDIYLAETYKRILKGDPDTIKNIIPEQVLKGIQQEARNQLIKDLREKEVQKRKITSPTPEKGNLGKFPDSKPVGQQSYRDIRGDVLKTMKEEDITLFY